MEGGRGEIEEALSFHGGLKERRQRFEVSPYTHPLSRGLVAGVVIRAARHGAVPGRPGLTSLGRGRQLVGQGALGGARVDDHEVLGLGHLVLEVLVGQRQHAHLVLQALQAVGVLVRHAPPVLAQDLLVLLQLVVPRHQLLDLPLRGRQLVLQAAAVGAGAVGAVT